MYTLLIGDDNRIIATVKERIVQRSKLVNSIRIIVPETYNGISMKECLAILYYQLPISKEWDSKELTASEELYKEKYVEYIIPVDTWLTKEYGDVNIEVTFYNVSMDGEIDINQYVRKATNGSIHISSSKDWAAGIADSMLNTVDQRIIQLQILQNRQEEMIEETQSMMSNKADSIAKDETTNEIYLTSQGVEIGGRIKDGCDEDGVPIIDLNSSSPDTPDISVDDNDVVEFD